MSHYYPYNDFRCIAPILTDPQMTTVTRRKDGVRVDVVNMLVGLRGNTRNNTIRAECWGKPAQRMVRFGLKRGDTLWVNRAIILTRPRKVGTSLTYIPLVRILDWRLMPPLPSNKERCMVDRADWERFCAWQAVYSQIKEEDAQSGEESDEGED